MHTAKITKIAMAKYATKWHLKDDTELQEVKQVSALFHEWIV